MEISKRIIERAKKNKYLKLFLEQYSVNTVVFSCLSLFVSLGFSVINLVSAFFYDFTWYISLALYYFVLTIYRAIILFLHANRYIKYKKEPQKYEQSKSRIFLAGGIFLLLLEIAMFGAITQMVMLENPSKTGSILAIATATYATYRITMSIIHFIKARKEGDLFTQNLRNVNLVDAMMSIVSLTVMMLTTFGNGESSSYLILKATASFFICVLCLLLALYMIVKGIRNVRGSKIKKEKLDKETNE